MSGQPAGNPLRGLAALGQSVWLDDIRRAWLTDGTLTRLIDEDGVSGMTSNPAIFEKAIAADPAYRADRERLAAQGIAPVAAYETLTVEDVRGAARLLAPVHARSAGLDGYVSIEVSPHLAHDAPATVAEALRLHAAIGAANVMIKVPATPAGVEALRQLTAQGVNVNATLLFGVARYRAVAAAYLAGLEDRLAGGAPLSGSASVASFFLSRIDTLIDGRLDTLATPEARALRGRTAIACARLAYAEFRALIATPRWQRLAAAGARAQRLLWASTSAKDPAYSDVKYVEALIGPDTVNTLPPETLAAYRDHGQPAVRIDDALEEADEILERLAELGISLGDAVQQLEEEGVRKFAEAYDRAIRAIEDPRPLR